MNKLLTVLLFSLALPLMAFASEFVQGKQDAVVDAATYDADINSFSVINAADYMKQQQIKYTQQRVLEGVPTLIVNGKYKINFQHLDGDFEAELTKLVNTLLNKTD